MTGIGAVTELTGRIGGHRRWVAATAALGTITVVAGVALIAMAARLLSWSWLEGTTVGAGLIILAVRTAAVTRVVARYLERYLGHLGTFRILTRLRVWLFRRLIPLSPRATIDRRSGDLLTALIDDVDTLQNLYLRVLVPPWIALASSVVVAVVLGLFAPEFAVSAVAALLVTGVVVPVIVRRATRVPAGAAVDARAERSALVVESLHGLDDLVALGRTDLIEHRLATLDDRTAIAEQRLARVRGWHTVIDAVVTGALVIVVLTIAVDRSRAGLLDPVHLALLPLVALAAFEGVRPMSAVFAELDRAEAAAGRMIVLADTPDPVPDPVDPDPVDPDPVDPGPVDPMDTVAGGAASSTPLAIVFDRVSARYEPDGPLVLDGLSFVAPAGGLTLLSGPSGAGKSTIVSLLLRFLAPCDGHIRIGDRTLANLRGDDARSLLATVQQHDHLFATTVRDNLLLADGDADDDLLHAACVAAAFDEVLERLPDGLDAFIGADGGELSGGERQRLLIARALVARAPVLVLDEATEHLDAERTRRVMDGIRRWQEGRTTLVIAHDGDEFVGIDHRVALG